MSAVRSDAISMRQQKQPRRRAAPRDPVASLRRGLEALCRLPDTALLHDTAIAVAAVARAGRWPPALAACRRRIVEHGLRDHDHPLGYLIDPSYRKKVNLSRLRKLPPPRPGAKRAPVNRIVHRAAHCGAVGFPRATFDYVVGPMRDQGGYHSTHAMWALLMMRQQRCVDEARLTRAIASVRQELLAAQARSRELRTTADVDLFAERLLFVVLAGSPAARLEGDAQRLLAAQRADGAFAAAGEGRTRYGVHATSVVVWALAEYLRRRKGRGQKL